MKLKSMREVSWEGMNGRKKAKRLLMTIITLTFTFIVLSTTLVSSMEKSKQRQREDLYGSWQGAIMDSNSQITSNLKSQEVVNQIGNVTIFGEASNAGIVATANQNFYEMANLEFTDGGLPQKEDEIALEVTSLGDFGKNISVGDTVTLEINKKVVTEFKSVDSYIDLETPETWEEMVKLIEGNYQIEESFAKELYRWGELPIGTEISLHDERIQPVDGPDNIRVILTPFSESMGEVYGTVLSCSKYQKADGKIGVYYLLLNRNRTMEEYTEWDGAIHNLFETEIINGSTVTIKSQYILLGKKTGAPGEFERDGILTNQTISIRKDYVVSGIFQNYTGKWAISEAEMLPNAFLSDKGSALLKEAFYGQTVAKVGDYKFTEQSFFTVNGVMSEVFNKLEPVGAQFEKNLFAFPGYGNNEDVMAMGLVCAIFIMEIVALLQIFLTQVKKRKRYIGLLKSIAYSNRQVCAMLLWEIIYILKTALPLGLFVGFLLSFLAKFVLSSFVTYPMYFYVDIKMFCFGVVFGVISVFLGIMVPTILAIRTPLLHSITVATKRKKRSFSMKKQKESNQNSRKVVRTKDRLLKNAKKRHGASHIFLRYYIYNKGKTLLNFGLSCLTALLLGITVFLSYQAFTPYREAVSYGNPDFEYVIPYTLGKSQLTPFLEMLQNTNSVKNIDIQLKGYNLEIMPENKDSLLSNLYSVDTQSIRYQQFLEALSVGTVNTKQFEEGEEVIVLHPLISKDGKTTYQKRYASSSKRDEWVKPGDKIKLKTITEVINVATNQFEERVKEKEVTVSGVIYYFPKENIWPFAKNAQEHVVLGSKNLTTYLYPYMTGIGNESPSDIVVKTKVYRLLRYGETQFFISLKDGADSSNLERLLMNLSGEAKATVYNYQAEFEPLRSKAIGKSILYSIFGISSAVLIVVILYNISYSRVEQERSRIGVLQAIGITRRQFYGGYVLEGLVSSLLSLLFVNLILILIGIITIPGISGDGITVVDKLKDFFVYRLKEFPYAEYGALLGMFVLVMTVISYLPIRRMVRQQPIENIQNREIR